MKKTGKFIVNVNINSNNSNNQNLYSVITVIVKAVEKAAVLTIAYCHQDTISDFARSIIRIVMG